MTNVKDTQQVNISLNKYCLVSAGPRVFSTSLFLCTQSRDEMARAPAFDENCDYYVVDLAPLDNVKALEQCQSGKH